MPDPRKRAHGPRVLLCALLRFPVVVCIPRLLSCRLLLEHRKRTLVRSHDSIEGCLLLCRWLICLDRGGVADGLLC